MSFCLYFNIWRALIGHDLLTAMCYKVKKVWCYVNKNKKRWGGGVARLNWVMYMFKYWLFDCLNNRYERKNLGDWNVRCTYRPRSRDIKMHECIWRRWRHTAAYFREWQPHQRRWRQCFLPTHLILKSNISGCECSRTRRKRLSRKEIFYVTGMLIILETSSGQIHNIITFCR